MKEMKENETAGEVPLGFREIEEKVLEEAGLSGLILPVGRVSDMLFEKEESNALNGNKNEGDLSKEAEGSARGNKQLKSYLEAKKRKEVEEVAEREEVEGAGDGISFLEDGKIVAKFWRELPEEDVVAKEGGIPRAHMIDPSEIIPGRSERARQILTLMEQLMANREGR